MHATLTTFHAPPSRKKRVGSTAANTKDEVGSPSPARAGDGVPRSVALHAGVECQLRPGGARPHGPERFERGIAIKVRVLRYQIE